MEPAAYARLEATAAANYAVEGHYVPYEQRASAKPSPPPPPTPPSPLEIKYSALLNKTCEAVVSHIPVSGACASPCARSAGHTPQLHAV